MWLVVAPMWLGWRQGRRGANVAGGGAKAGVAP
eukprot:COSAG02_NODE_23159_length_728_cov_1.055644_1_plen_32_part_01